MFVAKLLFSVSAIVRTDVIGGCCIEYGTITDEAFCGGGMGDEITDYYVARMVDLCVLWSGMGSL